MKTWQWILAGVALLAAALPAIVLGPFALRVQKFPADPVAGFHADYYLYVSRAARERARQGHAVTLLVQPNNSGTNSDDPSVHRKDAWWTAFGRHALAEDLCVVLLVPAFVRPAQDWQIYTHALDRDSLITERPDLRRPDLQLLAMVDQARAALAAENVLMQERFLIQGFSASGMFANRFTLLHPGRVLACAAGSPGGWPLAPVAQMGDEWLPYPAGVGDLELLTGAAFDLAAFRAVPKLLVLGSLDDNDSLDFRDGWEEAPAAQVDRLFSADPVARWAAAERLDRAAEAGTRFLLVEGVGHERKRLQNHTTAFFRQVLADLDESGDEARDRRRVLDEEE